MTKASFALLLVVQAKCFGTTAEKIMESFDSENPYGRSTFKMLEAELFIEQVPEHPTYVRLTPKGEKVIQVIEQVLTLII